MAKRRKRAVTFQFDAVEEIIGIRFRNRSLLREALTHRSYLNENPEEGWDHNERLEFLGDAVLEYVVCCHFYRSKTPLSEGQMTELKFALVNTKALGVLGEELGLGAHIAMSRGQRGEFDGGDRSRQYIVGCAIEAIIGAIHTDRGIGTAELFVLEFILPRLREIIETKSYLSPKTHFQELSQEQLGITPHYEVLLEQGPDHDKSFVVAAFLDRKQISIGRGSNKQDAETDAAYNALITQFNITLPK